MAQPPKTGSGTSAILAKGLGKAYRIYPRPSSRFFELFLPGRKLHTEF